LLVTNACTSGSDAIGIAAGWLRTGLCDVVICGGAEEILPQIYYGFKSMLLCSPERCKPFDKNRTGLTLGEGCGIVILEKADSPRKSLAKFLGYSSTSDAYHPTAPHPDGKWLDVAVKNSLRQAGLDEVDFINVHGTATEHNDLAEGRWIREHAPTTTVVATKGYTGHTLAAAGAVEAVLTVLSLREQKLPRSFGFTEADPRMDVVPTREIVSGDYNSALSFSLGFGGTNAVLCLGRST
jgi:3-oxoacyl-(acyl-carrier-protein) synthase